MAKEKCGSANELRKYKNSPEVRRIWRENYHKYTKPKRDAKKLKERSK